MSETTNTNNIPNIDHEGKQFLDMNGLNALWTKMCETFLAAVVYEAHNHHIAEESAHTHALEGNVSNNIEVSINSDMFIPSYVPGVLKLDGLKITEYNSNSGVLSISKTNTNTVNGTVTNSLVNCIIKEAGAHSHSGVTTAITVNE